MEKISTKFLRQLETALLENERYTCPNPTCTDVLHRRKTRQGDKVTIHYQCGDSTCLFHQERSFQVIEALPQVAVAPVKEDGSVLQNWIQWIASPDLKLSSLFK